MTTPEIIFVVPYRNRELQLFFFRKHMKYILEDYDESSYEILYIHQNDERSFNRGAIKNIGFLVIKNRYPDTYENITIVFNDIDTMPIQKNFFDYKTTKGTIKHFYGFTFTLGGILSITAGDFEMVNGFPNFWSWGYEDNDLQRRALLANLTIDRSHFYPIFDKNIIFLQDGFIRIVNEDEKKRHDWKTDEGIQDITHLQYTQEKDVYHVSHFLTGTTENKNRNRAYDLRGKNQPFKRAGMKMFF